MELNVLNIKGQETGRKVTLNEAIFGIEPNDHVIYLDVKQYLANQRQGNAKAKEKNTTKPMMGVFKKAGTTPKAHLAEFKFEEDYNLGDTITVELFADAEFVDVVGTSKGKGFQGVVKRHGFGGVGQSTHGQDDRLRKPGSIGACSYPAKVFKGMRMGGHMGGDRVTTQNLKVLKVIPEHNLLLVKGSCAGCNGSTVLIEK